MKECCICSPEGWDYTPGGILPVCEEHIKTNHKKNMTQGKPLKDNVRLEIHKSGFTAMENVDEKQDQIEKATVLETGDDVSIVKIGDVVLFKDYNLDTIIIDNEVYTIVPESDIKYVFTHPLL